MLQRYACHLVLANKMIESCVVSEYVREIWGGGGGGACPSLGTALDVQCKLLIRLRQQLTVLMSVMLFLSLIKNRISFGC